ncbi:MAG: chromosomal replication initiator DnaA [Alphaproteobacteria bacterium]|nr:chromosomal replication initiator DnaA [Alphaproteobacteria bacterium]
MVITPRQIVLPLPERVSLVREDYFVSASNRAAVAALEAWPAWSGGMLALIGPSGSGKTHLARAHAVRTAAVNRPAAIWPEGDGADLILEDMDRLVGNADGEERVFHAFNRVQAAGGTILFTARTPIAGWPVKLPDLQTRMSTVLAVDLPPPDDALLHAVLLKLFADRQIAPGPSAEVAAWLVPRMERSLAEASRLVAELDHRSLAEKRRIDTRLAAEILDPPAKRLL